MHVIQREAKNLGTLFFERHLSDSWLRALNDKPRNTQIQL